ncbi:MAG: enoyl-CoA hydratase/isomerase family protein [Parvularculaceae bacterium]|nr:enoyl-CoA hydratase/isomerase family protein [Parvularculaceae bacterium]
MTQDIIFERIGEWGVVTLNRPDALNALTFDMVKRMRARLLEWEGSAAVKAVFVKGAGEKAFSAGADIRKLHDAGKADPAGASEFFREEYRLNALIHHYVKPYVALIDGVTMGGGAGLSVHGDFRIAGDKTLFAMPETAIGLFPDVGGGHFLPRLHDGLGLYYALTGARAKAADSMAAGIATHYVPSGQIPVLFRELASISFGSHPHADIEAVIDGYAGDPGEAHVNDIRPALKRLFEGHPTFDHFWAALQADGHDVAGDILRILARMSPTSLKLTFEQMRRGARLDFDETLKMEFRMARRVMEGRDFFEGVRAVIIDKDRNPRWNPLTVEAVSDADIARYFEPLEDDLELP